LVYITRQNIEFNVNQNDILTDLLSCLIAGINQYFHFEIVKS